MDPAMLGLAILSLLVPTIGYGYSLNKKKREVAAKGLPQPSQIPSPSPVSTPSPIPTPDPLAAYTRGTVPPEYRQTVLGEGEQHNVPPALLAAQLFQESGFDPTAYNESTMESGQVSRDRGMAQVSDIAFPNVSLEQANDPEFAIDFMAQKLADYYKQFNNWPYSVAAYNVGPGRVGVHPSRPTGLGPRGTKYVQGVSKNLDPEFVKTLQLLIGGE